MVGSISNSVDTSAITSEPAGIKASNWFGYSGGYNAATVIIPGQAYWIKASTAGYFIVASQFAKPAVGSPHAAGIERMNSLTIEDNAGGMQVLYFGTDAEGALPMSMYELPPVPPAGAFDARFQSEEGGLMLRTHGENPAEFPIVIQSDHYPLTISWKLKDGSASYELTDGVDGSVFAARSLNSDGTLRIDNNAVKRLLLKTTGGSVTPAEFALLQNYPNPFNPVTSIKYALPVQSRVSIEIYNLIGQRVRTLVNEERKAGYHVAEWNGMADDGHALGSGVYFLRLSAAGTEGAAFTEVRKLMLLK
jgi:hypothetical protein